MNRRAIPALIAVLLALLLPPSVLAAPEQIAAAACPASADFETPEEPLENLGDAIKTGHPIEVLALGSASTVTHGEAGFPNYMMKTLAAALPRVSWHLTVRGGRGVTAAAMLDELKVVLKHGPVRLVIWQTATVEAVRGIHPEEMRDILEEGADLVSAQGGDIVLVDPQFSRFLRANTNLEPYERAMATAASMPGVSLFHRFDLMHSWVHGGLLDLERTPTAEQASAMALLNRCMGQALARFVLNGLER